MQPRDRLLCRIVQKYRRVEDANPDRAGRLLEALLAVGSSVVAARVDVIAASSHKAAMPKRTPLPINQRFGHLTVIGEAPPSISRQGCKIRRVFAQCDCGRVAVICEKELYRSRVQSCGCDQANLGNAHLSRMALLK
jgi:hypothetical protein